MFNNKKRLLSTFITAVMMCPVANGVGVDYSTIVIRFKKERKAYIRELAGPALNQLRERYKPINNNKIFAGHAGVVSQYECIVPGENYGKIVAVKCIVNPNKIEITTGHIQYDSIETEVEFFNKLKNYEKHPGIVNCYDIFYDDNVTYIVQDWLDGTILCDLPEELKTQSFAWKKKFIYQFIKKRLEATVFMEESLKVARKDPHQGNCMIVPSDPNETNFTKKYSEFDVYFVDWGECMKLEKKTCNEELKSNDKMREKENDPYFVNRLFDYNYTSELIWLANKKLGLSFRRSFVWRNNLSETAKLLKDFLLKCNQSPFADGPFFDYGKTYDKDGELYEGDDYTYKGDDQPIFFQNYDEIIKYCDAKIREAEKEMKISK